MEDILKKERERAKLSEDRRNAYDYNEEQEAVRKKAELEIAEEKRKFEEEKANLERQLKIYEYFKEIRVKSEKDLNKLVESEKFKQLSTDEQNLIIKLA